MEKHEWSVADSIHSLAAWGKMLVAEALSAANEMLDNRRGTTEETHD
jgi:hypothetical protein